MFKKLERMGLRINTEKIKFMQLKQMIRGEKENLKILTERSKMYEFDGVDKFNY